MCSSDLYNDKPFAENVMIINIGISQGLPQSNVLFLFFHLKIKLKISPPKLDQKTFDLGILNTSEPDWNVLYEQMLHSNLFEGALPASLFEDAMRRKHLEILTAWEIHLRELLQGMDWNGIQKASRKYLQGPLQEKHPFLILGKDSPGFRDIVRFEPVLNLNQEKEAKAAFAIRGEIGRAHV